MSGNQESSSLRRSTRQKTEKPAEMNQQPNNRRPRKGAARSTLQDPAPLSPSFPLILSIPAEVFRHHLAPFLDLKDFLAVFRGSCKYLLLDPQLKDCKDVDILWEKAIKHNKPEIILYILQKYPKRDPSDGIPTEPDYHDNRYTVVWASSKGHLEVLRLLLSDARVNLAAYGNAAIRKASMRGQLEVLRLLMTDSRVNPAGSDNGAIIEASNYGHLEVVRLLLTDSRVNPTTWNNLAIREASLFGNLEVVRLLMTDSRVNPADSANEAFRNASSNGHLEVARLLLTDARVNPAAENNEAIINASGDGHDEVVGLLLADLRVDAAANNDKAIRLASVDEHHAVLELLLDWYKNMKSVFGEYPSTSGTQRRRSTRTKTADLPFPKRLYSLATEEEKKGRPLLSELIEEASADNSHS
jgi:hypothetical protein